MNVDPSCQMARVRSARMYGASMRICSDGPTRDCAAVRGGVSTESTIRYPARWGMCQEPARDFVRPSHGKKGGEEKREDREANCRAQKSREDHSRSEDHNEQLHAEGHVE